LRSGAVSEPTAWLAFGFESRNDARVFAEGGRRAQWGGVAEIRRQADYLWPNPILPIKIKRLAHGLSAADNEESEN